MNTSKLHVQLLGCGGMRRILHHESHHSRPLMVLPDKESDESLVGLLNDGESFVGLLDE